MAGIITQRSPGNRVYATRLSDRNRCLSQRQARRVFAFYFDYGDSTVGLPREEARIEGRRIADYLDRLGLELCRKAGA